MSIIMRIAFLSAIAALPVQSAIAQEAAADTPRGTYFVHGDEGGAAFVSYEPALAATNVWPIQIFFYQGREYRGSARMTSRGDCPNEAVIARLTDSVGPDGVSTLPPNADPAMFTFNRSEGAGDQQIVDFVCGDAGGRLAQSSAPIFGTPESVARVFIGLRALGIQERLARDLAIRDPQSNEALIATAVPESMREQAYALMAGQHPD